MKSFKQHIFEKLKVSKHTLTLFPKTKDELVDLIIKEIETNGPNCSLNHIDVSNIDDMSYLFLGGTVEYSDHPVLSSFNGDISNWDVSNVENMSYMFCRSNFSGDISDWDVSQVTNMYDMFQNNYKFNGDISNWDVSNVIDMRGMFMDSKFNGDISNWNVSSITNIYNMFANSPLEKNPPKWYKK